MAGERFNSSVNVTRHLVREVGPECENRLPIVPQRDIT